MKTSNVKRLARTTATAPAQRRALWLLLIPMLLAGFLFFAAAQPAPYTPEVTGQPAVHIDQTLFDYGDVRVGSMVNTEFHVKNVGDKTLLILDVPYVEVVEGCCPPQTSVSTKRLAPGQEATVSMSFTMHPGMAGYHKFLVHVITNDPESEQSQVTVLSNWIE